MANVWSCVVLSLLPLRLSPLTEDTSMITVISCGVKLQEVVSGLEKKAKTLDIHMHFCDFSQHSFIHSFIFLLSTWGVTGPSQHMGYAMTAYVKPN